MWPLDLYSVVGVALAESVTPLTLSGIGLETYQALSGLERMGIQFGLTLLIGMVVLGLLQGYGPRTVAKSRRSPVISLCIGLPSLFVVAGLTSTGYLILGTSLGTFFGVILVVSGLTLIPILTAIGFVAIGQSIAGRFGRNRLWAGVVVGSLLSGLVGVSLALTLLTVVLAGALGTGSGVRVMMGTGGASRPDDRTVPPANKI